MPTYTYSSGPSTRRTMKRLETFVMVGLALMISFVVLAFIHPGFKLLLKQEPRLFPLLLVVVYLLFLIPSRRLTRFQRFARVTLATTRRGFTWKDGQAHAKASPGEKILSWRDLTEARVLLDVNRDHRVFIKKLIFVHGKGRISLENDPPNHALEGVEELLREVLRRVPGLVFRFHWFHAVCPFCKGPLDQGLGTCNACRVSVRYVSKFFRPWELFREEGLYFLLLLLVAGPEFYPWALLFVTITLFLPMIFSRVSALKPLELNKSEGDSAESEEDEGDAKPADARGAARQTTGGSAGLTSGVLLLFLFLATPCLQACASPSIPYASPVPLSFGALPSPSPSTLPGTAASDADYLPLAVGNHWEYRLNQTRITLRVTRKEAVRGIPCHVVESFIGNATTSCQVEYYAVTPGGLQVLRRTHGGSDFVLTTPETMLAFPVEPGRRWIWEGDPGTGGVTLSFQVKAPTIVQAVGRKLEALLVTIQGHSSEGSSIQTKRWYARGIGMVREVTLMNRGHQHTRVEAFLEHCEVRSESR